MKTTTDLSTAKFRKSSYSGNNGGCIEVASIGNKFAVRDTKDRQGPVLVFTASDWSAFVDDLR